MKILLPCIIDLKKSAPNRPHHFIRYLSKKHEITVICLNDWWKGGQVNADTYFESLRGYYDSIDIRYITERKMSPILQELFSPQLMDIRNLDDFDVIFNYNTLRSGYFLSKKLKIPMIYDIADDLPSMIAHSPQIPSIFRGGGKWFGEKMVQRTIRQSVAVSATTSAFQDIYSIPREKFNIIPNGVDTSLFRKVESSIRRELGLEYDFVLGYVGVLREWVDLTPVYQVLKKLDTTKLLVVGQEGLYNENQELAKKFGVRDKVIFTGKIPYVHVPEYIAAMDVCTIPFKNNDISHNAVPLKLFEYMACEKPVISTNLAGVKNSVGNRILYCEKYEDFYSEILKLKKDGSPMNSLQNNRKYVEEHYKWESIGMSVERILGNVYEIVSHSY
jgi:glycosyltransferase involved in cell wall biosynthesis